MWEISHSKLYGNDKLISGKAILTQIGDNKDNFKNYLSQ